MSEDDDLYEDEDPDELQWAVQVLNDHGVLVPIDELLDGVPNMFGAQVPAAAAIPASPAPPPAGGKAWASGGDTFWRVEKSHSTIPPGIYSCGASPQVGFFLTKMKNDTDHLIRFPDSASDELVEEIRRFQQLKPKFQQLGVLFKRGILMHGPPGSGKTVTLQLIMKLLVEDHGGIALQIQGPDAAVGCLQMIRAVEPGRQIVGVIEDIDTLVGRFGESAYLAMLDGESQIDNVCFVATTNFPEELSERFTNRPSRFDTVKYIGMPSSEARRVYLAAKLAAIEVTDKVIDKMVDASEGYSVAHLKELIILTQCFGKTLEEAIERMNNLRDFKPNSNKKPGATGAGFLGRVVGGKKTA